jgi:hypothetical protein
MSARPEGEEISSRIGGESAGGGEMKKIPEGVLVASKKMQ